MQAQGTAMQAHHSGYSHASTRYCHAGTSLRVQPCKHKVLPCMLISI